MSKPPFGMPGIGGSLGKCAICGNPFLTEILLGKKVEGFELEGFENTFYCHKECRKILKEGMDVLTLPAASPIRQAAERYFQEHPELKEQKP